MTAVVPAGCNYGHTKADHDAAGACVRPSLDARAVAAVAYPDATRAAVRIAFERGWDAATAEVKAAANRRAAEELEAMADAIEGDGEDVLAVAMRRVNSADLLRARAAALVSPALDGAPGS